MKNFKKEKDKLLSDLNSEIENSPENEILKSLNKTLKSYHSIYDLNGKLSRIILDSLGFDIKIGEELIRFENHFSDFSNSIKSVDLKRLAKYLIKNNATVTFYGKSWSETTADWMYFDKAFDLKKIRSNMLFGENIVDYQNLDSRSGLESGFIDKETGEGIMGKLK